MRRGAVRFASLVLLVFCTTAPLLAQEGAQSSADTSVGWIFRWINFAVIFGGIVYVAVKKGGPNFRRNADAISERVAEGAKAREAAEERRREIEAKLAGLDKEIEEMRTAAKRDSKAEIQRLRAMARDDAERIEKAAQAEITAAERAARLELKALTARLTVERAEMLLKQQLDPETDAALFRTFVGELGRAN
jgi:F0F1-type ATP synthase membrane subunit b/b'